MAATVRLATLISCIKYHVSEWTKSHERQTITSHYAPTCSLQAFNGNVYLLYYCVSQHPGALGGASVLDRLHSLAELQYT